MNSTFVLRAAGYNDIPAIQALIATSVRGLSVEYYTPEQIETAIELVFGVDSQLIDDHTYYVITCDTGAAETVLAAAGGWSHRRTLYGGDQLKQSADSLLDPTVEPARIRAFFVHPSFARRGLARMLFNECEREAKLAGFREFVLMATLPGQPLYRALGFVESEAIELPMTDGVALPLVQMCRPLAP
jgi:GNAT superfamily N-acetyltransferase